MNETLLQKRGLPGLRLVRKALEITQDEVSKLTKAPAGRGPHVQSINAVECGRKDCTQAMQRCIAAALCCEPADLLAIPTPERLAQIKADFDEARAAESRAAANGLKAVGQ